MSTAILPITDYRLPFMKRREFLRNAAAFAIVGHEASKAVTEPKELVNTVGKSYDVAVIGAGVFGAWTALKLAQAGKRVALIDQYGPANARASSGGESRIIRAGYGPDEIYTRWATRSLALWERFFAETSNLDLFRNCGLLWLTDEKDTYTRQTAETLAKANIACEHLDRAEIARRYPQFNLDGIAWGLYEPQAGALMARRAVHAVVAAAIRRGVTYVQAGVKTPGDAHAQVSAQDRGANLGHATSHLPAIELSNGDRISAAHYVFCCGPWLGKVFPALLGEKIFPSRQEVFFFGAPSGSDAFEKAPAWIFFAEGVYGLPDLEHRGFKVAIDKHGERVDPDTQSRMVSAQSIDAIRSYVARRFPALRDAPIVETRVCQYENTANGDFLIDRHPDFQNVWLVGGGSGHGFKHGPALGEYVAAQVLETGVAAEPRFSLASKKTAQNRSVY